MIGLPRIYVENNLTKIEIMDVTIWFSYETPVAFLASGKRVVTNNIWSMQTGKHLNQIDGGETTARKDRVSYVEFQMLYNQLVVPALQIRLKDDLFRLPPGPLSDWLRDQGREQEAEFIRRVYL